MPHERALRPLDRRTLEEDRHEEGLRESVESSLETWTGAVRTVLHRDGMVEVYVGEKHAPRNLVWSGSVEADAPVASGWRLEDA